MACWPRAASAVESKTACRAAPVGKRTRAAPNAVCAAQTIERDSLQLCVGQRFKRGLPQLSVHVSFWCLSQLIQLRCHVLSACVGVWHIDNRN